MRICIIIPLLLFGYSFSQEKYDISGCYSLECAKRYIDYKMNRGYNYDSLSSCYNLDCIMQVVSDSSAVNGRDAIRFINTECRGSYACRNARLEAFRASNYRSLYCSGWSLDSCASINLIIHGENEKLWNKSKNIDLKEEIRNEEWRIKKLRELDSALKDLPFLKKLTGKKQK